MCIRLSHSSPITSGPFITVNEFHFCAQVLDLMDYKLNLPSSPLSLFCAGVTAAPARTACQDGGVVSENLHPPVQCCEDDAV